MRPVQPTDETQRDDTHPDRLPTRLLPRPEGYRQYPSRCFTMRPEPETTITYQTV